MALSPKNRASMRLWIQTASYEELLYRVRHCPSGSVWFQGEMGDFFFEVLEAKKTLLSDEDVVAANLAIGW